MKKTEVFISYRREGGEFVAKKLRDVLVKAHYHAFMDIEGLGSGNFNDALLNAIDNSKDYVLILSENSLNRCENEDDWVRREIEYARSKNKKFVLLQDKKFVFPENLPESCSFLKDEEMIRIEYEKLDDIPLLLKNLKKILMAPCHKFETITNIILPLLSAAILVVALIFFCFRGIKKYQNSFPKTHEDLELMQEVFNYVETNLDIWDQIFTQYFDFLNKATECSKTYPDCDIESTIETFEDLWGYLNQYNPDDYALSSETKEKINSSKFILDDVIYLTTCNNYLKDFLMKNIRELAVIYYYNTEDLPNYSEHMEYVNKEAEYLVDDYRLVVNGILVPITSENKELLKFKDEVLIKYTIITFKDYAWLSAKQLDEFQKAQLEEIEKESNDMQLNLNSKENEYTEFISDELVNQYVDMGLTRDEAIDILKKQIELDNKRQQQLETLTTKQLENALLRYQIRQQLSYHEDDTIEKVTKKFDLTLKLGYYKIAADNLLHLSDMGEDIAYLSSLVESLQLFADYSKEYTYDDILLVFEYHDESENQKYFHPGDLIIGVNNKTFKNFNEFLELRDGKNPIQVLQIHDNRFELKTISCEGILGLQLQSFNGDN